MSLTANDKLKLVSAMQADGFDLSTSDLQSAVAGVEQNIQKGSLVSGNTAINPNSNVGQFVKGQVASNNVNTGTKPVTPTSTTTQPQKSVTTPQKMTTATEIARDFTDATKNENLEMIETRIPTPDEKSSYKTPIEGMAIFEDKRTNEKIEMPIVTSTTTAAENADSKITYVNKPVVGGYKYDSVKDPFNPSRFKSGMPSNLKAVNNPLVYGEYLQRVSNDDMYIVGDVVKSSKGDFTSLSMPVKNKVGIYDKSTGEWNYIPVVDKL